MKEWPRLSPEQIEEYKQRLRTQVDEFAQRMIDSVEGTRIGSLIADSEAPAREAIHAFGEAAFQAAVQLKIDAAEASFSPSGRNGDRSGDASAEAPAAAE